MARDVLVLFHCVPVYGKAVLFTGTVIKAKTLLRRRLRSSGTVDRIHLTEEFRLNGSTWSCPSGVIWQRIAPWLAVVRI